MSVSSVDTVSYSPSCSFKETCSGQSLLDPSLEKHVCCLHISMQHTQGWESYREELSLSP